MTATFRCFDFVFRLEATDPELQALVEELYSPFRQPPDTLPTTTQFTLVEQDGDCGSSIVVFDNHQPVVTTTDPSAALSHLLWLVNQRVISTTSGSRLLLHAAAAERDRRAVLLPAPSGSGKSTLVAALVAAGFNYLTDDLAAIDLGSGLLQPYAKPISIATGIAHLFDPDGGPSPVRARDRKYMVEESYLTCAGLGGTLGVESSVGLVVVPRYSPGVPTTLAPMRRAEALVLLGEQSFNFNDVAPAAFPLAAELVRGCDCYRLDYSDLGAAVQLVSAAAGV